MTQTIEDYHIHHQDNPDFIYPDKLFLHWNSMTKQQKDQLGIDLDRTVARETFTNFFDSRLEYIYLEFRKRKGVDSNDPKALYKFFRDEIPQRKKSEMSFIFYCKENPKNLFKQWCSAKAKIREEEVKAFREKLKKEKEESTKKEKNKMKRGQSSQKTMSRKERIRMLSKPKDRLKIGKTLLKMKAKFPEDRILREMIVDEFGNERVAKRPLEYDNFDSDEEVYIKQKNLLSEKNKEDFVQGELHSHKVRRLRERELLNRFSDMLKKYQISKNEEIKKKIIT